MLLQMQDNIKSYYKCKIILKKIEVIGTIHIYQYKKMIFITELCVKRKFLKYNFFHEIYERQASLKSSM